MIYFSTAILILVFVFGLSIPLKGGYSKGIEIFSSVMIFGMVGIGFWFMGWGEGGLLVFIIILTLPTVGHFGRYCGSKMVRRN